MKTEVEHLSGMWLVDPALGDIPNFWPTAWIFIGDHLVGRLDLGYDEQGEIVTDFQVYGYVLDNEYIIVDISKDDPKEEIGAEWDFDSEGNLMLALGDRWHKFVPATFDDLVDAGFDRETIDAINLAADLGGEKIK